MEKSLTQYPQLKTYYNKKVLITGGAGFVGSNVAEELVQLGAKVTVLDDLTTGKRELVPKDVENFVEGSVTDKSIVDNLIAEVDVVFHMAARVLAASTSDVFSDYSVNIGGTLNILSCSCSRSSAPPTIVYTSTSSVYGNSRYLPIIEDEIPNILSPYAASKYSAENYCRVFYEMNELPIVVLRYSNVYGRNQTPQNPYSGVVAKFLDACIQGRPMTIHGSGLQTRDFTYIDDAVKATLLAGIRPNAVGDVFNIGTGTETNIRQLASLIAHVTGADLPIEYIDRRDIDNVHRRVLNIEKARRKLRWIPEVSLDQGLANTYEWLKQSFLKGQ